MKEIFGDFWKFNADFYCITTNGVVNKYGRNIMGAGIALQAKQKFKDIDIEIGKLIKKYGNRVNLLEKEYYLNNRQIKIINFPTKHKWQDKSHLWLISQSSLELKLIANENKDKIFVLTWPGCGNGWLTKEQVRPIIEKILPDNVFVIERK